jgi:hypothetical protein
VSQNQTGQQKPISTAPEYASSRLAKVIDRRVIELYQRPVDERDAAFAYVVSQEQYADMWDTETGPSWHGWALHAAFLEGIDFQKAKTK